MTENMGLALRVLLIFTIIILCPLLALADDCNRFVLKKAVVNSFPIYRVMDGEKILRETSDLSSARYRYENEKDSCKASNDADEWEKILDAAKWEVIE
jgi:hypothetical protein